VSGGDLQRIADRIRRQLDDLEGLVGRIGGIRAESGGRDEEVYLYAMGFNLQAFYSRLERLFIRIARYIDGQVPEGDSWQTELLAQMTAERAVFRPAVVSESVGDRLNDYRSFRDAALYELAVNPERVNALLDILPELFEQVRSELLAFADFPEARQA
jgi:hypothetical protein